MKLKGIKSKTKSLMTDSSMTYIYRKPTLIR